LWLGFEFNIYIYIYIYYRSQFLIHIAKIFNLLFDCIKHTKTI